MSQFIQLPKRFPLQAPAILKGILSKVIEPSLKNSPRRSYSQQRLSHKEFYKFFDSTMDSRYVQEVKKADDLQNVIIDFEYKNMKRKLMNYGRSTHHGVQKIVRNGPKQKYFDSLQSQRHIPSLKLSKRNKNSSPLKLVEQIQHEHKQAKLRYSIGKIHSQIDSHDRTVFVDRKYNNEFAVKFSALKQAQQIKEMKSQYKQFLTTHNHVNPLVNQAKKSIQRKKYHTQYEKDPIESIGLLTKKDNNSIKNLYQPRKKQRSLIQDNHIETKKNKCKILRNKSTQINYNKFNKSLSCNLSIKKKLQRINFQKQSLLKQKHQYNYHNVGDKLNSVRKKQRKITWQKQNKI